MIPQKGRLDQRSTKQIEYFKKRSRTGAPHSVMRTKRALTRCEWTRGLKPLREVSGDTAGQVLERAGCAAEMLQQPVQAFRGLIAGPQVIDVGQGTSSRLRFEGTAQGSKLTEPVGQASLEGADEADHARLRAVGISLLAAQE